MFLIHLLGLAGLVLVPFGIAVLASIRSHSKMVRKYGAEALKQIRNSGEPLPW